MNFKINIDVGFEVNVFSPEDILNALVMETKRIFHDQGIPGFVNFLLRAIDKKICDDVIAESAQGDLFKRERCCKAQSLERVRLEKKKILTSLGDLTMDMTRLRCKCCKHSFVPLREFLGIKKHQTATDEFVKIACETIVEQSYRRTCKHFLTIGAIKIKRSKLHRMIMKSDCDVIDPKVRSKDLEVLIADGTGFPEFKLKAERENEKNDRKSDLKIVIGMDKKQRIVPIGVWGKKSWKSIRKEIEVKNFGSKVKTKPIAKVLVCDGEESLVTEMGKLAEKTQRCQWHLTHDFVHLMKYQEKEKKETAHEFASALHASMQIELPLTVDEKNKLEVEVNIFEAEKSIDQLIATLEERNYFKAAVYVTNAKKYLFTYLRYWLHTGILTPKVSSRIERMMREFGRRIKKIGFNWSTKGAEKMARILLKIIATDGCWENYWDGKINLKDKVQIVFRRVAAG